MLILRYLLKETIKSQLAIFLVLMAIFITLRFVRVLGDASDGDIPANFVISLISLYAPMLVSLVLPISAFLGIMIAHGRLYADSEMTVLHACGVSEWYVTRVMLLLSLVLMIITAVVTLYLTPLAAAGEASLKQKAKQEAGLTALIPGRFQQTGNQQAVIFVHDISADSDTLEQVFLSQHKKADVESDQMRVVYAQSGNIQTNSDGTRNLVLKNGYQFEGQQTGGSFRKVAFEEYQIQLSDAEQNDDSRGLRTLSNKELLDDGSVPALAELHWRIAIPLSIPLLTMIAVPLSTVNPRQGRLGKLLPAILLYMGYYLLLLASKRILEDGKIPIELGLWWIHGIVLIIAILLLAKDRKTGAFIRSLLKGQRHA